jgi:hypothetical protein
MEQEKKEEKKKGFFANWIEKLDKKLEAKAKKTGCSCRPKDDGGGDSCCR